MLACFAMSLTVSAAEPRSRRHDADLAEVERDDERDARGADERRPRPLEPRQMRELRIAGGALAGLGVVGLGVGVAGVALGAVKQKEADSKQLPAQQDDVERLDREGARANQMALAGFVVGGGLVAVGVALLIAGSVAQRRYDSTRDARIRVAPMAFHRGSGVLLQGRF